MIDIDKTIRKKIMFHMKHHKINRKKNLKNRQKSIFERTF